MCAYSEALRCEFVRKIAHRKRVLASKAKRKNRSYRIDATLNACDHIDYGIFAVQSTQYLTFLHDTMAEKRIIYLVINEILINGISSRARLMKHAFREKYHARYNDICICGCCEVLDTKRRKHNV